MHPVVTVIMPSHNSERFIEESIDSVINQTFEEWELIVIDDASTDGTLELLEEHRRKDERIRIVPQEKNQGPAHARNVGLSQARGDFVAFLDSDDVWHPHKTAKQIAAMHYHHADISYTAYIRRRDGDGASGTVVNVPPSVSYRTMLRRCLIGCSTGIVRQSTCGMVRMPDIARHEDHGYWLSLLRDGSRTTVGIREPLMWYLVHGDSLSGNKFVAARYSWKLLREVEGFHATRALWLFTGYAFEALKLRLGEAARRVRQ